MTILRGDFAGLSRMAAKMGTLAKVPAEAASGGAARVEELVAEEYEQGKDASGKPWAPLSPATRKKGRTPPPLTDKGKMRANTHVAASGEAIRGTVPHPAELHQSGTSRMPARPIAPGPNLSEEWQEALKKSSEEAVRAKLEGK